MNPQSLGQQVDGLFENYNKAGSPGGSVAVVKDGHIIHKQGYGLANVEHNIPNTPSTRFNIGSEAKQFTAMAILLLVGEGQLSLDDDIQQHLPQAPDFGETITIRHLIHHTSGLRCSFPPLLTLGGWLEGDLTTNEDVVRLFMAQRELNFKPGQEFSYANMGYIVLAKIVERCAEQSFARFCRKRIFEPLGMANTVIQDSPFQIIPNRAQSYWTDDNGRTFNALLADAVVGPTNVYTTVEDLALWDENFYSGQVGGKALIRQMQQPGRLNDGTELDYAFGLMSGPNHKHQGWQMVEHGGGQGGYVSALVRFPKAHLSVLALFNLFHWGAREYALKVASLYLDGMSRPQPGFTSEENGRGEVTPVELSREQLQNKEGRYFDPQRVTMREISLEGDTLKMMGLQLLPLSPNEFLFQHSPDARVTFTPGPDERPVQMQIKGRLGVNSYQRVEPVSPTPEALAEYAGLYYSPELNVYWQTVLEDDQLIVKHQRYKNSRLTAVFADGFKDDWTEIIGFPLTYMMIFRRDADGTITGFAISDDRMRNLTFIQYGK